MATLADAQRFFNLAVGEASFIVGRIKEKGAKHFAKPLGMTGGLLAVSYFLVYGPSRDYLAELEVRLAAARATSSFAADYKDLAAKLKDYSALLPRPADKDGWLFNAITESAEQNGIILGAIGSQAESNGPGYVMLSIPVTASLTYVQLGNWLAALESSPKLLKVTKLSLRKEPVQGAALKDSLGRCDVNLEISTFISKLSLAGPKQ